MATYKGLTPAQAEANKRYDAKTYKQIALRLRLDEDADIIAGFERAKQNGYTGREWIRQLFEGQD